jgi:hypothetical protein
MMAISTDAGIKTAAVQTINFVLGTIVIISSHQVEVRSQKTDIPASNRSVLHTMSFAISQLITFTPSQLSSFPTHSSRHRNLF